MIFIKKILLIKLSDLNRFSSILSFSIVFLYLLSGCGYRLIKENYKDTTSMLIAVKPLINYTSNPELDWRITDSIVMELANWQGVKITIYDKADYVITGKILSYRSQIPYTYDRGKNPLEYKINLLMSLSMARKSQHEEVPLQRIAGLQEEEIYRLNADDLGGSKREEWHALERAVKRMLRRAMDQFIGISER